MNCNVPAAKVTTVMKEETMLKRKSAVKSVISWAVCRKAKIVFAGLAMGLASPAQTVTTIANLNGFYGASTLTQGLDGSFYGTTVKGQNQNPGTIFKVTADGVVTELYHFSGADGLYPNDHLTLATSGNFYGTTSDGGKGFCEYHSGCGTVFRYAPGGTFTTIYRFGSSESNVPAGRLVQAIGEESFYGNTSVNSSSGCTYCGSIFKINASGVLTTLHSFGDTDGTAATGLARDLNGKLYGTTLNGGSDLSEGTAFTVTPAGQFTTLYNFGPSEALPNLLTLAGNGEFYGTTREGGNTTCDGNFGCGVVFTISPAGELTNLSNLPYEVDGNSMTSTTLLQATDGNFYGAAIVGDGCGSIFKITPTGVAATIYSFPSDTTQGCFPVSNLIQATDGNIYGSTQEGVTGYGTIFRLSLGLHPFVKALPDVGQAGSHVKILGTNLTGTTSVQFNGTDAVFTTLSPTEISATVPTGAASGAVQVTTPTGTLLSEGEFVVEN